jgi:hypothetical protein
VACHGHREAYEKAREKCSREAFRLCTGESASG